MGLHAREETPARTPWWLLLLRMVAAALVILALARPVLDAGSTPGRHRAGPAGDRRRLGVGRRLAAPHAGGERRAGSRRARRTGRWRCSPPRRTAPAPRRRRRRRCRSPICAPGWRRCSPSPGRPTAPPPRRRCAPGTSPAAAVVYLGDGLDRMAAISPRFAAALGAGRAGDRTALADGRRPACCCRRANEADRLVARIAAGAAAAGRPRRRCWRRAATAAPWRARSSICRPARASGTARDRAAARTAQPAQPAGAGGPADAPPRSCCSTSAGGGGRSGLLAGDIATADTPFAGSLYYLRRALAPFTEVREADLADAAAARAVGADPGRPAAAGRCRARRADQLGGAGRPADPLRRAAHRRTADRRDRSADAGEAAAAATASSAARCPGRSRRAWRRSRRARRSPACRCRTR